MHSSFSFLAAGLAVAAAKTITINVGKGGLNFSPASSSAEVGDTLEFHFFGSFHTAVQGDFDTPCGRVSGTGFNSGPIKNGADGSGSVFQVQVKDKNPIYFYCATPSHCQSGMVGAINAPSSGNTLEAYKAAAASASSSELGPSVQGGVVVPVGTNPPEDTSTSSENSAPSVTSAPAQSATPPATNAEPSSSSPPSVTLETSSEVSSSTGSALTKTTAVPSPTTSDTVLSTSKVTTTTSPSVVPASEASLLIGLAGQPALIGVLVLFGLLMAIA